MEKILVIGSGYVGLTTGVAFSHLGHDVTVFDVNKGVVKLLNTGHSHIIEKGMPELINKGLCDSTLAFVDNLDGNLGAFEFIFVCVQTPENPDGSSDLTFIDDAVREINKKIEYASVVIVKSTIPVGAAKDIRINLSDRFALVLNPEFMREGQSLQDFLHPSRIVIGSDERSALDKVASLYSRFETEIIKTNFETAALIKYASNAFLALKLSFINEIAGLATIVGAELTELLRGIGSDPRIGKTHLNPGPGWGGSCFPKDSHSLLETASRSGVSLLTVSAAVEANDLIQNRISEVIVSQVKSVSGERQGKVSILGLAFKSGTNDTRESPAIKIGNQISLAGLKVQAFDPAVKTAKDFLGEVTPTIEECVRDSDLLVVMTEWDYFYGLDPARILSSMRNPYIYDTRNLLDVDSWRAAGAKIYPLWLDG